MKYSRELVIGLMFIVALAVFIWGYNFLKGISVFDKERVFYGVYDKVDGLMKSNPVSINGMKVGQVKDLYFDENYSGNIIVIFELSTDFPIPENSLARIFSSDLMGSKAVEIRLGDAKELAQSGDTLRTGIEMGIKEEVNRQVQPLKRKAENLITSIDSMVFAIQTFFNDSASQKLYNSLESIEGTFRHLNHTAYQIDTFVVVEEAKLSKVINNIEGVTATLVNNRDNINEVIANMKTITDSLAKSDIPGTFEKAKISLTKLSAILEKINQKEGTAGMLINDKKLYEQLAETTEALKGLIEEIKANPKKFVKFSVF